MNGSGSCSGGTWLVPSILTQDFQVFSGLPSKGLWPHPSPSFPIQCTLLPSHFFNIKIFLHKKWGNLQSPPHLGSTMAGSFALVLLLSPWLVAEVPFSSPSSSMPGASQWIHCLLCCLAISVFSRTFSSRLRLSGGGVLHLILSGPVTSMVGDVSVSHECSSGGSASSLEPTQWQVSGQTAWSWHNCSIYNIILFFVCWKLVLKVLLKI